MNIFFDNTVFSIQRAGGVSIYWYELISRFINSEAKITFLNGRSNSSNIFEQKIDYDNLTNIKESKLSLRLLRYLPVRYKIPPRSIFHSGYLRTSLQNNLVKIITIYDFGHEKRMSTGFPRKYANIFQKRYGIKKADGIICISENTKKDLLHYFPKIDPGKVKAIHLAASKEFFPLSENFETEFNLSFNLKEKYILYVGERSLYKNFYVAVEVIKRLQYYKLVIAGGSKLSDKETEYLQQNIPGRYFLVSVITSDLLNILYNYAFCFLYPSGYEGFGIPPLEAMKAGCPVITTNKASIPEVVGDAGLMVDEINVDNFIDKMRMLEDEEIRQKCIQLGFIQAAKFSWDKCFEETFNFYKYCWDKKFLKK